MPPPPPSLAEVEAVTVALTPDSDDWVAYAIVGGIAPATLAGTEFLVDADGWLRAVMRAGAGNAWPSPDRVAAAIKDAYAHPVATDDTSAMHHHH